MRIAFVCDTAYQVLNALNYVYANKAQENLEADLFVGYQFHNAEELACRLRKELVFANIYGYHTRRKSVGIVEKLQRIYQIMTPMKTVHSYLAEPAQLRDKNYAQIFMSMPTQFSVAMAFAYPNAEIYAFDDGIGSYEDGIGLNAVSRLNQIIYRIVGKDLSRVTPKAVYLNNPAFYRGDESVKALPSLADAPQEFWGILERVWQYPNDGYYSRYKFICLTQPNDDNLPGSDAIQDAMLEGMMSHKEHCMVRPHPRQQDLQVNGLMLDDHRDMWELVCAGQIDDSHILVSLFSTSQLIPKMFYDKEPTLVFTGWMMPGGVTEASGAACMKVIDRLRQQYTHPERIFVPKSREEYEELLQMLG
jgi:hypothetical protein